MAILVAETSTNLSTALGFTNTLSANLGTFSATELSLSSTRTISFTPSAAQITNGIILALSCNNVTTSNMKSVVVNLKESGTIRATQTISASTIVNSTTLADGVWFTYFNGGTFPYLLTATAGVWTIEILSSGAQSTHWSLRTSDGTNPFFIVVGSTPTSYTDNTDQVVAANNAVITLDQNFTLKGVAVTGDATRSVCAVGGRRTSPDPDNCHSFLWTTASSITGNIDGLMLLGAHGGFRAGTSGSPISVANAGVLNVILATTGTASISGFSGPFGSATTNRSSRTSIQIYGEIPSVEDAVISGTAAVGQAHVITTTNTGWANPDRVFVGGQNVKGPGVNTAHVVSSVSTNDITLTANLATNARVGPGHIIRMNGYGFKISGASTSTGVAVFYMGTMSNFVLSGVQCQYVGFLSNTNGNNSNDDAANRSEYTFNHMSFEGYTGGTITSLFSGQCTEESMRWTHVNGCLLNPHTGSLGGANNQFWYMTDCIFLSPGPVNTTSIAYTAPYSTPTITRCSWENGNNPFLTNATLGVGGQLIDCYFWGNSSGNGCIRYVSSLDLRHSGNSYQNNTVAIQFGGITSAIETDSQFGNVVANTTDITSATGSYFDYELVSCTGNLVTSQLQATATVIVLAGSILKSADFNDTTNDDRGTLAYGSYQRCGTGLSDTTARTSGGYSLRLAPTTYSTSARLLAWPNHQSDRAIPTGNIQNMTMTVSVWVYINNTAYDAGVYTMPTLNVKYDNTTTVTDVATATFGSWQQLSVTFTPTTTYGQIEAWLTCATDAGGTNAYVYIDDFQVSYPAGQSLNLGALDLWAHAVPVWPPIATVTPADSLWDSQTSAHTDTGSFGELATRTEIKVDDATALILSK